MTLDTDSTLRTHTFATRSSLTVTLLGTGSPMPAPDRAGPSTLVSAGVGAEAEHYLIDAGRGVLMRMAALGLGAPNLTAVLLTHLHSDHITDLNDVITTRWIMTFTPTPLTVVGPVGTRVVVDHILASLGPDISYRIAHHDDLNAPPPVTVIEVTNGPIDLGGKVVVRCEQTDHKPVEPSIGFRFDFGGASVVTAGDTVPCAGLDALCAGAGALVHTVIRKDVIANLPMQRIRDTLGYHSSPEEAAQTAARNNVATLVLTHYVPPIPISGTHADWRNLAAAYFTGTIEVGDDLHKIVIEG
jgi:ribonuclease Z